MVDHVPQGAISGFPNLDPRDAQTLSLLGHDLRAALSEVTGSLRLIDTAALNEANRDKVARSAAATEALSRLLEQALAFMLDERGRSDTAPEQIQTDRLLENIRLRWTGRAQDNGMAFHLDAPDLPAILWLDMAVIERVLSNLLGNAIKFAGKGMLGCKIRVAGDGLSITVTDDGPGFAPEALPRLFELPNRVNSLAQPGLGLGLGLHIVRDMVAGAGGRMAARNRATGGAEVTVHLPLPAPLAGGLATAQAGLPDLARCRVLLADDSQIMRSLLQRYLCQMGAEVVVSADGVEAVGRLEREHFDLLVIDIEMPGMTGLDVIHHLRHLPGPMAQLPIVAVTAHSGESMQHSILTAGATVIVAKPLTDAQDLGAGIAAALRQTAPDPDRHQFDRLLTLAGPAVAAELVDRLLEDLRLVQDRLHAAQQPPDWVAIRAQSHVLIALAGTIGAHRLQHLAETLNQLAHNDGDHTGALGAVWAPLALDLQRAIRFIEGKVAAADLKDDHGE